MSEWPTGKFGAFDALEIGRAAEHIVVADLILQGIRAFLTDQGFPYDVVAECNGRLLRLQVKATQQPKNVNSQGRNPRIAYSWSVRRRGKHGKGTRLSSEHCDIVALVALDTRLVAYMPIATASQTIQLLPPGAELKTRNGKRGWAASIAGFPFSKAIEDAPDYGSARRALTACVHGHPYPENQRIDKRGRARCTACDRISSRLAARRRRARASGAAK